MNNILTYSKQLRLLYVEDNKDSREATKKFFHTFFDDIIVAVDGEDGYNKFSNNKFLIMI